MRQTTRRRSVAEQHLCEDADVYAKALSRRLVFKHFWPLDQADACRQGRPEVQAADVILAAQPVQVKVMDQWTCKEDALVMRETPAEIEVIQQPLRLFSTGSCMSAFLESLSRDIDNAMEDPHEGCGLMASRHALSISVSSVDAKHWHIPLQRARREHAMLSC